MRIYSDKLAQHIQQHQYPIYLVFGNDPLLRLESCDEIWKNLQSQGVESKYRYHLDAQTDWETIFQQVQAFGLFSSKELYIFDIPESGMPASAQNHWHSCLLCKIVMYNYYSWHRNLAERLKIRNGSKACMKMGS